MAGVLTVYKQRIVRYIRSTAVIFFLPLCLHACDQSGSVEQHTLLIPERKEPVYVTDQAYVAGNSLFLWNSEGGGCQLQVESAGGDLPGKKEWLKPMAPCYFIKSPGGDQVQVFRQNKTTRIVAVLGTPLPAENNRRCGKEVQGLVVDRHGKVKRSERILAGSVYCASSGLDNFQYSLFYGS